MSPSSDVWRVQFGEANAVAAEKMLARVFPGWSVEWGPQVSICRPVSGGGLPGTDAVERRQVFFPGFAGEPTAAGATVFVTALEFPAAKMELWQRLWAFEPAPAADAATRILVLRIGADGAEDFHQLALERDGVATDCRDVWTAGSTDGWPQVHARYYALYALSDKVGVIEWNALIDSSSMSVIARVPAGLTARTKAGVNGERAVSVTPISQDSIRIDVDGLTAPITYQCGALCVVPEDILLAAI